jgi:hypothetical protein
VQRGWDFRESGNGKSRKLKPNPIVESLSCDAAVTVFFLLGILSLAASVDVAQKLPE